VKKKAAVKRRKRPPGPAKPIARIPLPKKGEKRHGDRTKYDRAREKERLRRELPR
jgi:hypothetical protein